MKEFVAKVNTKVMKSGELGNPKDRYERKLFDAVPENERIAVMSYLENATSRTRQLILFNLWYRGRHDGTHDVLAGVRKLTTYKAGNTVTYPTYVSD